MVRIAIVEDDKHQMEMLQKYISRYEKEVGQRFQVYLFRDGEDITEDYSGKYDVILMDIEMQFMDGMTAAEEIRKIDTEVVIIFITNMPQYAMKGYAVEALDYVLKPINYYAFSQRIDRALERMTNRKKKYLNITSKGTIYKIDISTLYYIEVQNHDLCFHTKNGNYTQRGTMKEMEEKLSEDAFFRCNKCYLINLECVNGFDGGSVLLGEEKVQVSRAKKKEFMDALNNYLNEVSK